MRNKILLFTLLTLNIFIQPSHAIECGVYRLRGILIENPQKVSPYIIVTDPNSNSEKKWPTTPSSQFQKNLKYFLQFMIDAKISIKKENSFFAEIEEIKWTTPTVLPYDDQDIISVQLLKKVACEK